MQMLLKYALSYTSRLRREEGQTMAEYAVVLGVITLAVVGVFVFLGNEIFAVLQEVVGLIDGDDQNPNPAG